MEQEIGREGVFYKIAFWVLLGPVFLIISLFLAAQKAYNADLYLIAILSLGLCYRYRQKGMAFSLFILAVGALFKHIFVVDGHIWQLGLELSFGLGIVTTGFSMEQMSAFFSALGKNRAHLLQNIALLEEEINKNEESKSRQAESMRSDANLLEEVREQAAVHWNEKEDMASELFACEKELSITRSEVVDLKERIAKLGDADLLQGECRRLQDQLNEARMSKMQTQLISESLSRMLNHNPEILSEDRELLIRKIAKLQNIEDKYSQLRAQFEEKDALLHEARKALFATEERVLAADNTQRERELIEMPFPIEDTAEFLQEEISHLEEVVSLLSAEKRA